MRGLALSLIALGAVLGLVGLVGTIVVVQQLAAGGDHTLLIVFLILAFVGTGLLSVGVALYRRARSIGSPPTVVDGKVGLYTPDVPTTRELAGVEYRTLYTPPVQGKNSRPSSLRISVPVDTAGEFHMAPETWFDRFCKRIGLAVEIQTGDATFDAECYVRSDAVAFTEEYLTDPVKRIAILDVRRLGFPEVILKDRTVTAVWTGFNPAKHDKPDLTADAAARLVLLARDVPRHKPEFDHRTGQHRHQWQVLLWCFLVAFALTIFSLIAYRPTWGSELFGTAALAFVPGTLLFAYLSARLLRGTSTSHYAWGGLMLGALFLFPLGSVGAVALLNGVLDDSPPATHTAAIVEKYTSRSKNTTHYNVRCTSWRPGGGMESFQISSADYNAVVEISRG